MADFAIALIGCGSIARRHRDAAAALGVEVLAAVDTDATRAEAFAASTQARAFTNVEAMLDDRRLASRLRAAVVATPPATRRRVVEVLAGTGLSLLLEKPLAHTHRDALEMTAALSASPGAGAGAVAVVGYCHRFTPAIAAIRARARAGEIGTVIRFENTFAASMPGIRGSWMSDPAISGGGSLIDTACHSLDLFGFLVGTPSYEGCVLHHAWPGRGESHATLLVSTAAEAQPVAGVISSGWLEVPRYHVALVGTEGRFEYDYDDPRRLLLRRPDGSTDTIPVEPPDARFAQQFEAFVSAVETGEVGDLCTFEEAAAINAVVDAAYDREGAASVAAS